VFAAIGLSPAAGPASAHGDLDYTVPTDGASVGDLVSEITIAFTEPVTLVGNGFEVLDPQGNLLLPFAVTDDDIVFRLQLDPPIGGGEAGVRYEVTSSDGHTLSGSFSFTVAADAPATTGEPTVPVTSGLAPTTGLSPTSGVPPATGVPVSGADEPVAIPSIVDVPDDASASADEGDDGNTVVYLLIVGGVIALAITFVLARSRSSD